ncbi:MAG: uroporphyrinogen-III C-methyltransferase [Gammaproteobacteria bacterium]|nr:uroporphyrinogen-III C-methyltransferase [Gammaproteobacteria bacterium]MBU1482378.1 uroporphyrinogen-III C-methyltransferase [Gammaproteobacteria bacterium]
MSDPIQQSSPANQSSATPEAAPAAAARKPHRNRVGELLSRLTLTHLTLLVLVVVFVWQWLDAHSQLNLTQQQVARRLFEVETATKTSQLLLAQNQELVRELGGKLSLLETRYAETQNQRAALESLYQEMSGSREQTALAEVEQMLLIAGQQLQLSGNVRAALIAMQQAESRLQRPVFAKLRQRIDLDAAKLRALPSVDVAAINLRLDGVIAAVDKLELAQDTRVQPQQAAAAAADPAGNAWKRFWRELWQETRNMVVIENTGRQEMPLLSPTQAFFLRENLKLRLLSARMALLTRDEVSFRRDLKTSQEWLKRYFDIRSAASAQALGTLQKLAASNIVIDLPDISGSLEAVRNYRVSHERGAQ